MNKKIDKKNISKIISILFLTSGVFLLNSCKKEENIQTKQPNIIIILADDLGYKDVGFNGSLDIATPNIDRIAQNGVVFTNGYVSFPVCGPSRAGLITGRYQSRFGFNRNPLFAPKDIVQGLPLSEETIADSLGRAGYQNMAIGKWHLGAHTNLRPLKRGFNEFFGFLGGGHRYFPLKLTLNNFSEVKSKGDSYKTKLLHNDQRVEEKEYLTDAFSREAVNFVSRNVDKPFFLYLAYNAPHTPLEASKKYLDRFSEIKDKKRKIYAAMVSAVDDGVGNLLDKLEELNIADNTIIFFLSDNGGPEDHGANNAELRAGKGHLYEGGIRVPFAMQWPAVIKKKQLYHQPIISLDIFATAVAYANATTTNELDGVNLVPYLIGQVKGIPHKQLYWRKFYGSNPFAIRSANMKLVRERKNPELELYNVVSDISEEKKLYNSTISNDLKQKYEAWNAYNINPAFLGAREKNEYDKAHPNRFIDGEKY